jgi:hypothetical protein
MGLQAVEALLGPGNLVSKGESARFTEQGTLERSAEAVLTWLVADRRFTIVFVNDAVVEKWYVGPDCLGALLPSNGPID